MSDIRTKILMGTTISAVSVMLVMAVGMATVQNNVPTAGTALGLMGHFEIMVQNPDGTASYAQGDNVVVGPGKNALAGDQFDGTGATQSGPFICTQLGTGTNDNTADDINAVLTDTAEACDASVTGNCAFGGTTAGAQLGAQCTIITVATIDGIAGVDANDQCLLTCLLTEVRLQEAGSGTIFAQTALGTDVVANTQAEVTVTYKIAVGGAVV